MLDGFEILTTSGVVLWSKHYAPVGVNIINSLIKDIFIENSITATSAVTHDTSAARNPPYKKDKYTVKWTTARDIGLIFVAVYQSLIHLSWIDELLDNVKTLFTTLYRDQFKKPHTSVIDCPFDDYFDRQIQELEKKSGSSRVRTADLTPATDLTPTSSTGDDLNVVEDASSPPVPGLLKPRQRPIEDDTTSAEITPIQTPESSRPTSPSPHLLTAKNGPRNSRRARKAAAAVTSAPASRDASTSNKKKEMDKANKKPRKWGDDGLMDDGEAGNLDYSAPADASADGSTRNGLNSAEVDDLSQAPYGKKTGRGEVVLKDLDEEMDTILTSAKTSQEKSTSASKGIIGSSIGSITSLFQNAIGGATLTHENLVKPLKGLEEHLITKNVAREAAVRLCELVEQDLVGTKTASFQSIDTTIRAAMERALSKILTPTSSLDLLRSIQSANSSSGGRRRPYVMSIVGVNGVGKSTTLSKLAFLLLHNNLRVLVCAADTFRSGAVEQLAVHVRNLQQLTARSPGEMGHIDLFSSGYGKDAAIVAQKAVEHAQTENFDVVLIDTAGRRHNDAKLMSSLERFAQLARPDKILMVGEALVGTDSVAQARHFNASFGVGRKVDGFVVSKCDTVGEMVGTLVSLVFATGVPIVAVGVGQHYGDLRGFNVAWATGLLMS